jgi:hypothetical protein
MANIQKSIVLGVVVNNDGIQVAKLNLRVLI